jgi:hypothetical protein
MSVWEGRAQLAGAVLLSALVVCCGGAPTRTASQPAAVPSPAPAAALPSPPAVAPSPAPAGPPAALPSPPAVAPSPAPAAPRVQPPAAGLPPAIAPARPGGAPPGTGDNWYGPGGGHRGLVALPEAVGTVKEWQGQADVACTSAGYPLRCLSITYRGGDPHTGGENCAVVRVIPRSPVTVQPNGKKYVQRGTAVTVVVNCSGASPRPGTSGEPGTTGKTRG